MTPEAERIDPLWQSRILPNLCFWAVAVLLFWQALLGSLVIPVNPKSWEPWAGENPHWEGKVNPLMGDALTLTYPWRVFNAEGFEDGGFRFWNPYIFSGYPHYAALQSNAIYPPVVLLDLIDPIAGIGYALILHFGLAGTLMFCFLRRLGVGLWAAFLGGLCFELNGFFLVRMSAPSYVFSGVWVPLLMLGCLELMEGKRWLRGGWKVASATALGVLGGHPQVLVLMLLLGGTYSLALGFQAWRRGLGWKLASWRLVLAGIGVVVGIGFSGVQLLPFLELVEVAGRSPASLDAYERLGLPFVALGQAVVPDLFGHSADGSYWLRALDGVLLKPRGDRIWGWNYCGENLYTGVVPLLLALIGLVYSRRFEARFFGFLGSISMLVLLGIPGVLDLFYYFVPSFSHSRSDRIVYLYMCVVPVLAALGWEAMVARPATRMRRSGMFILSLPFLAVMWQGSRGRSGGGLEDLWKIVAERSLAHSQVVVSQGWKALVLGLVVLVGWKMIYLRPRIQFFVLVALASMIVVPMVLFSWKFNPVQSRPLVPTSEGVDQILDEVGEWGRVARWRSMILPPNVAQQYGIFDTNGASNAALKNYHDLITSVDAKAFAKQKYFRAFQAPIVKLEPLFRFLGVEVVLTRGQVKNLEVIPSSSDSSLRMYRTATALPRFFLVDCVETYSSIERAYDRFHSGLFPLGSSALVAEEDAVGVSLPCVGLEGRSKSVDVVSYGLHRIDLEVDAESQALLVSSEVDYPGWEVEIDGKREEKIQVNTAFRGVFLAPGNHQVSFVYVPRSFYWGLFWTVLSLALFGFMIIAERRVERKLIA